MRKKKKDRHRHINTVTSFTICLVKDPSFTDETCVLMVNNIADKERLKNESKTEVEAFFPQVKIMRAGGIGKPEGIGLPGGGKKIEDIEQAPEAARREFLDETGLEILNDPPLIELFVQPYLFIVNEKTGETIRGVPFEKGKTPPFSLKKGYYAVFNFVHTFSGHIQWEGSNFQKVLKKVKEDLIASGETTQEWIDEDGIWVKFSELTPEELDYLAIEEKDEINMMGIFPLKYINEALKKENRHLREGFYYRHLKRIQVGLEKMGIEISA